MASNVKPVEFSNFYKVLNAAKQGNTEKKEDLEKMLEIYKDSAGKDGPLHQLGETFIYIGIMRLYEYSDNNNIEIIGSYSKEDWEDLAEEKKAELPPFLANSMINYAKEESLSNRISERWNIKKREIDRNLMQMARYITEGIIDAID